MTDAAADPSRFQRALDEIDAANREDPNISTFEGAQSPAALQYGQRMTRWLGRLDPGASEPLRLAVRCQHIRRWTVPRSTYPMTRAGYHQWRTALGRFHAEQAGEILRRVGYDEATVARVQSLVRKERLASDPETQTLEDVACLVFLEGEFADFSKRHDEQKVLGILRRTWRKMSEKGRAAAIELAAVLPERERELIRRAAAGDGPGAPSANPEE